MGWYVLQCRPGQEQSTIQSCAQHLSEYALESAFNFRCERLWRVDGVWKTMEKDMFPGYVFLQSSHPGTLSKELDEYRGIVKVMEDNGYLISLYDDEELFLRRLCGEEHYLKMSYGYIDREKGTACITEGPLKEIQSQIIKLDWHKRFAQVEIPLLRQKSVVWAGLGIARELVS